MHCMYSGSVMTNHILVASSKISPSLFSYPVFGPVIVGTIAGCGGTFLPLSRGLDPLKNGCPDNIMNSFIASAAFVYYINNATGSSVEHDAKLGVTLFLIFRGLVALYKNNSGKLKVA